jgi:hypothetical protein
LERCIKRSVDRNGSNPSMIKLGGSDIIIICHFRCAFSLDENDRLETCNDFFENDQESKQK